MKKFRFLSSLTLASAIVSGVAVTSLAAGTTASTGVLKKGMLPNVPDKDVVGYLLTDANDTVTVEDILNAGKYTSVKLNGNTNNASKTDTVTTGDNFTAGNKNEKRHVVVYNEVNRDGKVDIDDVTDALDIVIGSKKDAEDLQKEAADVKHDGTLDIDDVTRMLDFVIGAEKTPVAPVPQGVEDVEELKYNITVNGNNTVNSENESSSTVSISLKSGRVEEELGEKLSLRYVNDEGKSEKTGQELKSDIQISKYGNQIDVDNVNFSDVLEDNETKKEVTLRLYNTDEEIVGEVTISINVHKPEAVEISAIRNFSYKASLSFKGLKDSDIVKAYYQIVKTNDGAVEKTAMFEDSGKGAPKSNTKVLEGLNNTCVEKEIEGTLETTKGAAVYFVVEDSAGNRSEAVYKAVIPSDDVNVKQEDPANGADASENKGKVTYDNTLNFTWDTEDNENGYIVRVCDEAGNVIKEYNDKEIKKNSSTSVSKITDPTIAEVMSEPGKYIVKVIVKGKDDGTTTDSEPIQSDVIEIKQLNPVTDITFTADPTDPEKATLTWKDIEHKDDKAKQYQIKIEKRNGPDEEDWEDANVIDGSKASDTVNIPADELKLDLSEIEENTLYRATIQVVADDSSTQKLVKDSEPATSETNYFTIGTSVISVDTTATTNNSISLTVNEESLEKLGERDFTYEIEIYTDTQDDLTTRAPEKRTVTLKDGKLVIDGLEEGKRYSFVVKMTSGDVSGESSRSKSTALNGTVKLTAPVVKGTVASAEAAKVKGSNKVNVTGDTLTLNGEEYTLTDSYYDPDGLLKIAKALIPQLHQETEENSGDIVKSIEKEKVSIKVDSKASDADKPIEITLSDVTIPVLEMEGNENNQTIKKLDGVDKVILSNGEFTLDTNYTGGAIELAEGAHLKGAKSVTIAAKAHVKINDISVYAKNGAKLTADGVDLTFDPIEDASNEITISNETSSAITVKFTGDARLGDKNLGTITITSKAKVTVETDSTTRVDSIITVSTTDADIDVQDEGLAGSVNVTVSNPTDERKITAYATMDAPFKMTDLIVKEYTTEELKAGVSEIDSYTKTSDIDIQKIQSYMKTFETIWGKGIKLTVDPTEVTDKRKIELKVPEGVTISVSNSDVLGIISK